MSALTHPRPPIVDTAVSPAAIVRGFHPGWFAAVMGTGIVGVAAYLNPGGQPGLRHTAHTVGVTFVLLAWLLAVAIAIPYLARLARHRDATTADLRHPIVGAMYATFPAAILVLAVATAAVGGSLLPAHTVVLIVAVLAAIGSPLALAAGVLFAYVLFSSDGVSGRQRQRRLVHPAGGRDHHPARAHPAPSPRQRRRRTTLIGHPVVVPRPPPGEGPRTACPDGGPAKDQPVPAVVRCREAATGRSPGEGLVYEHPQRYLPVGALSSCPDLRGVVTDGELRWR